MVIKFYAFLRRLSFKLSKELERREESLGEQLNAHPNCEGWKEGKGPCCGNEQL